MHQLLATFGVLLWAGVLTTLILGIPRVWGHFSHMSDVHKLLAGAPYYPIQITVGVLWGWLVWNQFRHREMLWVWVFPLIALVIGMLETSTRMSELYPNAVVSNFQVMLLRFFGSQCRVEDHCFTQFGLTLPFYAAVSYAVGARLALRFPIRSRFLVRILYQGVMAIGILILANTIYEVIRNFGRWRWWLVLLGGAFEALMGMCLIIFAMRMKRMTNQPVPDRRS